MSCWTHITACLSVETYITEKDTELRKQVQEFLKNAPEITGSEGNADIFVNIPSGYNWFMSLDCEHCEYETDLKNIIIDGKEVQECYAPEDYDCSGKYQSCIVISIQGDLRDRTKETTQKEFDEFREYIKTKYCIRDYSLNIESE